MRPAPGVDRGDRLKAGALPVDTRLMTRAIRRALVLCLVAGGLVAAAPTPAGAASGFVAAGGPQFTLDGQLWRPIGFDQYRLTSMPGGFVCDAGYGAIGDASLARRLDEMKSAGANAVRTWFFQSYFESKGWAPFDRVVEAAATRGMTVIPVLANQYGDCEHSQHDRTHVFYESGFRAAESPYTRSFKAYARMVAEHYAHEKAIAFWQLVNEAEVRAAPPLDGCLAGAGAAAAVLRSFAGEMAAELHAADPNHLVSLGTIGSGQCGASFEEYKTLHEVVDVCEVHDYGAAQTAMPGDAFNGIAFRIQQCDELGKPIFVGEAGIPADVGTDGASTGTTSQATLDRRAQDFDAKLATQLSAGMDGYLIWEKLVEDSAASYNATIGRFGIGRLGLGTAEDPVAAVLRAAGPAPSPSISAGPAGVTSDPTPTFSFASAQSAAPLECRVGTATDPGTFSACASPLTTPPLDDGARVLEVRALGGDPTPARRDFVVDTGPPQTTIDAGPDGSTNDATPTFSFGPAEPGGSFQCRIGTPAAPGTFAPCGSPYTAPSLADGDLHRFEVRAIDAVGAIDATPASRLFSVDTVAQQTAIDAGPEGLVDVATATFAFSSDEAGTFECGLAPGAFLPCNSPHTTSPLADGPWVFEVRAVDPAGNADPSPASRSITVRSPQAPPAATPPAGPPPLPPPGAVLPPVIGAGSPAAVRVGAGGRVRLPRPRIACPHAAPRCTATASARAVLRGARMTSAGRATISIAAGHSAAPRFMLKRGARTALRTRGRLKATVTIVARHGATRRTRTVRVTLRRARRR
jgi:hypothetical protein